MVEQGDAVYEAFTGIGWGWGGQWNTEENEHFGRKRGYTEDISVRRPTAAAA